MLPFLAFAMLEAANPASSPGTRQCAPIRAMTYNIRLDLASDGPNSWPNRRAEFIGQIQLMQPAILGLQEVVATQKRDLEQALRGYEFLGVARDDGRSAGEFSNVAIDRSIFKLLSSGTFWLSLTPNVPSKGWDAAYRRIATFAHLVRRSDGARFLALNTHLDNEGEVARREGAREIILWITAHREPRESVIMTGDLNSEPGSQALKELTSNGIGLRDSRGASKSPPVGPEGTFNDFQALPVKTLRIDYILVDPSIEVERYAVLAWHRDGGRVASDHFPVVADLAACRK